jgi:hypothetical protein
MVGLYRSPPLGDEKESSNKAKERADGFRRARILLPARISTRFSLDEGGWVFNPSERECGIIEDAPKGGVKSPPSRSTG